MQLDCLSPEEYQYKKPFPYMYVDDVLEEETALKLQQCILDIPITQFDRYNNPFEQKYTLRDKNNYPKLLQSFIDHLTTQEFIDKLSALTGYNLINDPDKNFYGVHVYEPGDYLDIHVDAGRHPRYDLKKQVTLGLYLSYKWKEEYGCELELWKGDNAGSNGSSTSVELPNSAKYYPKIYECVEKIAPMFNRLVIFTNDDYSWHGNPTPAKCPPDAKRIFVTLSYLSDNADYQNKRVKAYFVARPDDPVDEEKDKLRLLRADPEKYAEVYRCSQRI